MACQEAPGGREAKESRRKGSRAGATVARRGPTSSVYLAQATNRLTRPPVLPHRVAAARENGHLPFQNFAVADKNTWRPMMSYVEYVLAAPPPTTSAVPSGGSLSRMLLTPRRSWMS